MNRHILLTACIILIFLGLPATHLAAQTSEDDYTITVRTQDADVSVERTWLKKDGSLMKLQRHYADGREETIEYARNGILILWEYKTFDSTGTISHLFRRTRMGTQKTWEEQVWRQGKLILEIREETILDAHGAPAESKRYENGTLVSTIHF